MSTLSRYASALSAVTLAAESGCATQQRDVTGGFCAVF